MRKLRLTLIPMCIGCILLLLSWYLSYPVSIDSPYDFAFNHFSYLYWLGLAVLFASFFIVAMETKNNSLRWVMTIGTVLLIFSQAYFYYMVPGSDANEFRGLTEYFVSTGDLSLKPHHYYYQFPLSFVLSKTALSITGLDLRYFEFLLFGLMIFVITSLIYIYISKVRTNAYVAVIAFFIILLYFFNFQWIAPFSFSFCLILLLFHLDGLSEKPEVILAMLIIFTGLTFTHILAPLFFVVYCLLMYNAKKNRKHLHLFMSTSVIYALVLSHNMLLAVYSKQLTNLFFLEILYRAQVSTTSMATAPQPYIGVIAQFFSRTVVITTTLITALGFILLLRRKKLGVTDYVMLLTGATFAVTLLVSPREYHELSDRAFFLICIPASLGASYLCESKFKKFFKPIFLILLVLFTFALMNQTFYDRQIFFQTKEEYQLANFMIDNIDWNASSKILAPFRFEAYLMTKSSSETVIFWSASEELAKNMLNCDYVAYTVGLTKDLLAANYSVETSCREFEVNHFNLIYNSGNYSYILSK